MVSMEVRVGSVFVDRNVEYAPFIIINYAVEQGYNQK